MLTRWASRLEARQEQRELASGRRLPGPVCSHPPERQDPSCSKTGSALVAAALAWLLFWLLGEAGTRCHLSPLPETLPQPSLWELAGNGDGERLPKGDVWMARCRECRRGERCRDGAACTSVLLLSPPERLRGWRV